MADDELKGLVVQLLSDVGELRKAVLRVERKMVKRKALKRASSGELPAWLAKKEKARAYRRRFPKECVVCGAEFDGTKNAMYCSSACNAAACKKRRDEAAVSARAGVFDGDGAGAGGTDLG